MMLSRSQARTWWRSRFWGLALALVACGGCVLPMPNPRARAGRLSAADGQPVANATVVVESLSIDTPPGRNWPGTPVHRFETRTDGQGHWRVPGGVALRFGIPIPDAMPLQLDEYTFTAPDGRILRKRPGLDAWKPEGGTDATLRSDWDAPPPMSVSILPAVGIVGGAAQKISGHLGVLFLVFRDAGGGGLRIAAEAGVTGAGGSAALVVPYPASAPLLSLELGARYLRPWSGGASRDWIAPEIAFDLSNLRFTLTLLDLGTGAARGEQQLAFGVGWGFF
jgi:hypothetical protein